MAEPSYEELKARLAELEKQTPGRRTGQLDFRVGEKGGVSVYGLGRFPVTLYYEQWIRLLDTAKEGLRRHPGRGDLGQLVRDLQQEYLMTAVRRGP